MSIRIDHQTNTVTINEHGSAPSTPPANNVVIYAKADGLLYSKDDAGTETQLSNAAATSAPNTQIIVGSGTGVTSFSTLTYNGTTGAFSLAPAASSSPGNIVITAAGNSAVGNVTGGSVTITAGAANDDSAVGGNLTLTAGHGGDNGGEVTITAGSAGFNPGHVTISAGTGTSEAQGGNVTISATSGNGGGSHPGGYISLTAGNGASGGGLPGDITLTSGNANGNNQPGGSVIVSTGTKNGSGTDGTFKVKVGGNLAITVNHKRAIVHEAGDFASEGDAQTAQYVLKANTTDNTQTEMFTTGSARLVLPNDTTWKFEVHVVARRTDSDDESASYKYEGAIDRNGTAASTAIVGSVMETVIAEDTAAWSVSVDADTTNGSLRVRVTGENAKDIRWVAFVRTVEVTG